jgi:hypothetical protein
MAAELLELVPSVLDMLEPSVNFIESYITEEGLYRICGSSVKRDQLALSFLTGNS